MSKRLSMTRRPSPAQIDHFISGLRGDYASTCEWHMNTTYGPDDPVVSEIVLALEIAQMFVRGYSSQTIQNAIATAVAKRKGAKNA